MSDSSAVPATEAVKQLRVAVEGLVNTPQGEKDGCEACVQAAASDELLCHPDAGVRMWSARCILEGLRIFAPDAPFDTQRIRSVLSLVIEQFALLADPSGVNFSHAVGILERSVEIRAFLLVFDCSNPEQLITQLVAACLHAARTCEGAQLEGLLGQLLIGVLSEADEIPRSVLMWFVQELMPGRRASQAKNLVSRVLGGLANRSAALPINDFLNSALHPQKGMDDHWDVEADLKELYAVVHDLYVIEPALVARVLPNLHADLVSSDVQRRCSVAHVIGLVIAHYQPHSSRVPLLITHPLVFARYLERLDDAEETVRLAAMDSCLHILQSAAVLSRVQHEHARAVVGAAEIVRQKLLDRCLDPSDLVRRRVVEIAAQVANTPEGVQLLMPVLPEIFGRIKDRRVHIREYCAEAIAKLYAQHAFPAWASGKVEEVEGLVWIPQLLCEAYSVFSGGRLGHTACLEEHLEQHVLGCGSQADAPGRALALLGLHAAACGTEASDTGLRMLLARKREANAALRRFLRLRLCKGGPILEQAAETGAIVRFAEGAELQMELAQPEAENADAALRQLVRTCPAAEERSFNPEEILNLLRHLDSVRDKALWGLLDSLTCWREQHSTAELPSHLAELDRLLRIHHLEDLVSVFRRALLWTWCTSDQAAALLTLWSAEDVADGEQVEEADADPRPLARLVTELPSYFPGAFAPHAATIVDRLKDSQMSTAYAAIAALAALGKQAAGVDGDPGIAGSVQDVDGFLDAVVKAVRTCCTHSDADVTSRSSVCRKAVRALGVLPLQGQTWAAASGLLLRKGQAGLGQLAALHLAAACLERTQPSPTDEDHLAARQAWLAKAEGLLSSSAGLDLNMRCAVTQLKVAVSAGDDISALFDGMSGEGNATVLVHAATCALRALRRGTTSLTTSLLARLAKQVCGALAPTSSQSDADGLVESMRLFQKPGAQHGRLTDRLRICATLPTMFALSACKRHRDVMQRVLQTTFMRTVRRSATRKEPLVDFVVASFLHFLSRLDVFLAEATAKASAFQESTKISVFFVDAIVRGEPSQATESIAIALRVCERIRYFVDRENPGSDAVHRAAHVLRYVVERRCPELGKKGKALLLGAPRGSMPAELFLVRQDIARQSGSSGGNVPEEAVAHTVKALVGSPGADIAERALQATRVSTPVQS